MTTLRVESRQFAATAPPFNVPRLSFAEILGIRKLESLSSSGVVCVILRLAVSVEHRLVTDGQTDEQSDRQTHDDS